MRQKSGPVREPAEQVVKDIRRATRRHFSAEEKIRIVLEGLRGEDSIAELCRREGIVQNLYYRWSKEFLEAGKKRLAGDTARAATSDEVKDLRREASRAEGGRGRADPREPSAQKKRDGGWGGRRMRYPASEKLEIIRLVEQSHLPVRRTLEKLGIPQGDLLSLVRSLSEPAGRKPSTIARPGRIASGTASPTMSASGSSTWRWTSRRLSPRELGRALHRHRKLLCVGSFGLSPAEGARSDRQPGLHRHQGGRRVQGQDHGAQPALADRLHLSQGHRLGLVLSVDRPRRLLALHHRLEAVHDDEGRGCHRHARPGAARLRGSIRPGSFTGRGSCQTTAPATSRPTWPNGSTARTWTTSAARPITP